MTPTTLTLIMATVVAAAAVTALILLLPELSKLQARVWELEQRLANAHVSISAKCGIDWAHTHTANISFPSPMRKTPQ